MHYPFQKFLIFLATRKLDPNPILKQLKLPPLSWEDSFRLGQLVKTPPLLPVVDAYFRGDQVPIQNNPAFLFWTNTLGVQELWERQLGIRKDPDVEEACRSFANPAMRTVLGLLLTADFASEEIVEIIYRQYGFNITTGSIGVFQRLFWNTANMSRSDWAGLFEGLPHEQRNLLILAFEGGGKAHIKHALGIVPELELRDVLSTVLAKAHMRFLEIMDQPNPDEVSAMRWAALAIRAGEKRKAAGGGPGRKLSEELQMALKSTEPEFPSLAELEAGKLPNVK